MAPLNRKVKFHCGQIVQANKIIIQIGQESDLERKKTFRNTTHKGFNLVKNILKEECQMILKQVTKPKPSLKVGIIQEFNLCSMNITCKKMYVLFLMS